jgi:hypothetical protein
VWLRAAWRRSGDRVAPHERSTDSRLELPIAPRSRLVLGRTAIRRRRSRVDEVLAPLQRRRWRLLRTTLLPSVRAIEDLGRRSGGALHADVRDAEEVLRESTGEMIPCSAAPGRCQRTDERSVQRLPCGRGVRLSARPSASLRRRESVAPCSSASRPIASLGPWRGACGGLDTVCARRMLWHLPPAGRGHARCGSQRALVSGIRSGGPTPRRACHTASTMMSAGRGT